MSYRLARADNPGPMTLEGTNSYLLPGPDGANVVVDPGPALPAHLAEVRAAGPVGLVLLTHGHPDHAESADELAEAAGAQLRAGDPARCRGAGPLRDGEELPLAGGVLRVHATPGHTSDSLSFELVGQRGLLTGDTVLGRGPSVVDHPDGNLADYLASLARLATLAGAGADLLLPGHGPVGGPAQAVIAALQRHREQRLAQVRGALEYGCVGAEEVVEYVYRDVDRVLIPAALRSVRAALVYLRGDAG